MMKRVILFLVLGLVLGGGPVLHAGAAPLAASATKTSPSRVEERWFFTPTLGRNMHYYVYLPAGYDDDPQARYPVLYMLHGMGGNANEWLGYGAGEAADNLMGSGAISRFIIAFPHGERGYWVDQLGGPQWATYLVKDVVPEIDRNYRTIPDRAHRAIGGLSMGAHGAIQIPMNHPDIFGIIGSHSPSMRTEMPGYFGTGADLARRDPVQLIAAHPEIARTMTIWLDFGLQDGFRPGQLILKQELDTLGIPYDFHEWPGDHSGVYWHAHVEQYLRFYDAAFAKASAPSTSPVPGPLQLASRPIPPVPNTATLYYFPETRHTLDGSFKQYWDSHGGLYLFGYPLTQPFQENGWRVQYFERARFEYHPENAAPDDVLLGLLGRDLTIYRTTQPAFQPVLTTSVAPDRQFFPATGHSLGAPFSQYWEQYGGLAQFGYPISEAVTEISPTDGQPYLVQYFERARFEYHPENAAPNDVLLGLLGQQAMLAHGWQP